MTHDDKWKVLEVSRNIQAQSSLKCVVSEGERRLLGVIDLKLSRQEEYYNGS